MFIFETFNRETGRYERVAGLPTPSENFKEHHARRDALIAGARAAKRPWRIWRSDRKGGALDSNPLKTRISNAGSDARAKGKVGPSVGKPNVENPHALRPRLSAAARERMRTRNYPTTGEHDAT